MQKRWTILIYMAADNDLNEAGVADLIEMKKVGSSDRVDVIVQIDRARAQGRTQRLRVRRGGSIDDDVVETLRETNTGSPTTLQQFVRWGVSSYPAERYILVVWNHGSGWDDSDIYRLASNRILPARAGIGFDDSARDFLDSAELKSAMEDARAALGRPLDILAFDACLMNMIEVVYQLRGTSEVIIGSEEVEPDSGWPYHLVLRAIDASPEMRTEECAKAIVQRFMRGYRSERVTQSALRTNCADDVRLAIDQLCDTIIAEWSDALVSEGVITARVSAQSYTVSDYVDLIDFCKLLVAQQPGPAITAAARRVIAAVKRMVILSRSRGTRLRFSTGLSIYFPLRATSSLYARLDFARDSRWPDLLALCHERSVDL